MKVYLGSDHRGFKLAQSLEKWLKKQGFTVANVGAKKLVADDDYVDYAFLVAKKVSAVSNAAEAGNIRGIVICGSGIGVDIVANKVKGVRCGLGFSEMQVRSARNDDDINMLALAADFTNTDTAKKLVKTFLETPFAGEERHKRRIEKISKIDH